MQRFLLSKCELLKRFYVVINVDFVFYWISLFSINLFLFCTLYVVGLYNHFLNNTV